MNLASDAAFQPAPLMAIESAARGGIVALSRTMAHELAPHNIQVNAISPGYFATELNRALIDNEEFDAWVKKRTPAGRWGTVDELIGAAVFLASGASSFVNGHILYVDGGITSVL